MRENDTAMETRAFVARLPEFQEQAIIIILPDRLG